MEASRKITRVSGRQIEMLWVFLSTNRDVATAHNRSLEAKEYAKKKWTEMAKILNSQEDGTYKDWKGWSKYWVDYKGKLKARAAAVRSARARGESSNERPFTELEHKFLQIMSKDFEELPVFRVDPNPEPPEMSDDSVMDEASSASVSICQNIESIIILPKECSPETLPPTPVLPCSPNRNPTRSQQPAVPPTTRFLRRRRQKREAPMAPEAVRRALVNSSQMRAEAELRSAMALEKIATNTADLRSIAENIADLRSIALNINMNLVRDEKYFHLLFLFRIKSGEICQFKRYLCPWKTCFP